jgi:hypothetical protein
MKLRPVVLLALLPSGCATADFTPYTGAQQKWPTAPGAFVQVVRSRPRPDGRRRGLQITCLFRATEQAVSSHRFYRRGEWQPSNLARLRVSDQRSKKLCSTAQTPSLCLLRMWRHADTAPQVSRKASPTRTSMPSPTATAFTEMPTLPRMHGICFHDAESPWQGSGVSN